MRAPAFPAVAGAAWAVVAAQAALRLAPEGGWTLCPFFLATGHRCPGCGMGRSLLAAWRGEWAASWASHPLGLPLLAVWTAWLAWGAWNLSRGRDFSHGFLPPLRRPAYGFAVLAFVLAVHLARAA